MLTEAASFLNRAPELFKASSNEYGEKYAVSGVSVESGETVQLTFPGSPRMPYKSYLWG